MSRLTGGDLLWNRARWTWSGAMVGNMEAYVSWEDDTRPILYGHAQVVEAMHAALPWHERMVTSPSTRRRMPSSAALIRRAGARPRARGYPRRNGSGTSSSRAMWRRAAETWRCPAAR